MFGSTNPFGQSSSSPFGQSSSSPFGSQQGFGFGQTSNASNNPFAPKPFGSPSTPFGAQTASSTFGGTSTGVFGQQSTTTFGTSSPSLFGSSAPSFGQSSTPAFGQSSTPAFGQSSTPAFGQSSSTFGSGSLFGQKPAFGGFGSSSPSQSSPFGATLQQTQPAFGSSAFGATSTPAFGSTSTPAFGPTSTPAFGATSTPAFGATGAPLFGTSSTPGFGATSTPGFGATSTPGFGATSTPGFGATSTPGFGATGAPGFGATSTPGFGATSTPAFGATTTPAFGSTPSLFGSSTSSTTFGSMPAFGTSSTPFGSPAFGTPSTSSAPAFGTSAGAASFGQTGAAFGSTPFGTTPSPFNAQTSPLGTQATMPAFGQTPYGSQAGGTRIQPYSPTPDNDGTTAGTQPTKLESISAMPVYKDKSHEELRWEDYQRGDKGGPNPSGQAAPAPSFAAPQQPNTFAGASAFGQSTSNLFPSTSPSLFGSKPQSFGSTGFGSSSSSGYVTPFGNTAASSSPFASSTTTTPPFGQTSGAAFGSNTSQSLFPSSTSTFSSPSLFGPSMASSGSSFGTGLSLGSSQTPGMFQSTPAFGQAPSTFAQASSGFQSSNPAFNSGGLFNTPQQGMMGLFSTAPASVFPATSPFQQSAAAQTQSAFSFPQTHAASSGGLLGAYNSLNQGAFGQSAPVQSNMVVQPAIVTNPFGTLPATPQISIGHGGASPSVQYGISSLPVAEKPLSSRTLSVLVPRHLSQRRIKLPPRKYNPKSDAPRVPFFDDRDEPPSTPKADAFFIPRENPRNLIIRPIEQWPPRDSYEKRSALRDAADSDKHNNEASEEPSARELHPEDHHGAPAESARNKAPGFSIRPVPKENGFHYDNHAREEPQAPTANANGIDVESLLPKLRRADYYTEPQLEELAAKERAEPGFCRHVKDFVVGRRGYGSIKFLGETDVREIDLELIVEFNNREVVVYKDDHEKPPVGHELNKPAEGTLLNIKCTNKKTGEHITAGPRVEKYKEMLMRKGEEQGAEFVSYDPVKGEWKFRVKHF